MVFIIIKIKPIKDLALVICFMVGLTKDFFKDPIFNKNMLNNDRKNEGIKLVV